MKVNGESVFQGPRQLVWDTLQDPDVLAGTLPGCEQLDRVGEGAYQASLKIKVGPVQGVFKGKVNLEDLDEPSSYTMQVEGRGAPGFVKATGHVKLEVIGDTQTRFVYQGSAQVGGRLASVGQRLIETSAKAIIGQSLEGLNAAVKARAEAAASGDDAPKPPAEAPSQAQLASAVAREVANEFVPVWMRWATAAVVAAVLLWIFL